MPVVKDKNILDNINTKKLAVETGTHLGDGVQRLLELGFEHVISIEIEQGHYNISKNRFINNSSVEIVHADSVSYLKENCKNFPNGVFISLDGHYSGGSTGFFKEKVPLLSELETILVEFKHEDIMIVIDDVGCWNKENTFDKNSSEWESWSGIEEKSILEVVRRFDFDVKSMYDENKISFILMLKRKTR